MAYLIWNLFAYCMTVSFEPCPMWRTMFNIWYNNLFTHDLILSHIWGDKRECWRYTLLRFMSSSLYLQNIVSRMFHDICLYMYILSDLDCRYIMYLVCSDPLNFPMMIIFITTSSETLPHNRSWQLRCMHGNSSPN